MKERHLAWILGTMILGLVGCATQGPGSKTEAPKPQVLSPEEQDRYTRYRNLKEGLFVDEFFAPGNKGDTVRFHNECISYEGVRFLRFLGLRKMLNEEESRQFIQALFEGIPLENPPTIPIRNIVVPRWYITGFPLILQVTTTRIKRENEEFPALLVLMNVHGGLLETFGPGMLRTMKPQYAYPRFVKDDKKMMLEADDFYAFAIRGNMIVTSSDLTSKELPPIGSAKTNKEKINLADSYLRDEDPSNDSTVYPVLKTIYEDESSSPVERLYAGANLFLFYLYQKEDRMAEKMVKELNASPLLENRQMNNPDIKKLIQEDLPLILAINRRLSK